MAGVNLGGGVGTMAAQALGAWEGGVDRANEIAAAKRRAELELLQNQGVRLDVDKAEDERRQRIQLQAERDAAAEAKLKADTRKSQGILATADSSDAHLNAQNTAGVKTSELLGQQADQTKAREKASESDDNQTHRLTSMANRIQSEIGIIDKSAQRESADAVSQGNKVESEATAAMKIAVGVTTKAFLGKDVSDDLNEMFELPTGTVASTRIEGTQIIGLDASGNPVATSSDKDGDGELDPAIIDIDDLQYDMLKKNLPAQWELYLEDIKAKQSAKAAKVDTPDLNENNKDIRSAIASMVTGGLRLPEGEAYEPEVQAQINAIEEAVAIDMARDPTQNYMEVVQRNKDAPAYVPMMNAGFDKADLEAKYRAHMQARADVGLPPRSRQEYFEIMAKNRNKKQREANAKARAGE